MPVNTDYEVIYMHCSSQVIGTTKGADINQDNQDISLGDASFSDD